jgi:hypothetical protein
VDKSYLAKLNVPPTCLQASAVDKPTAVFATASNYRESTIAHLMQSTHEVNNL